MPREKVDFSVRVHCGDTLFRESFEQWLRNLGLQLGETGDVHLLVDRPLGWAILAHPEVDFERCIILSDNTCPPYQLNLLDKKPAALIRLADEDALLPTLRAVARGNTVHPKVTPLLTLAERKTLDLVARGLTNKEIADQRNVTEHTVKNSLSEVYRKLELHSRVKAAHYYLGIWHMIDNRRTATGEAGGGL